MNLSIGYEKQYEKFKNKNINNSYYTFNDFSYTSEHWNSQWVREEYKPKDQHERFLLTSNTPNLSPTEDKIGVYDTFEEVYNTAISLNYENLYINDYCANIVFSNKNIKYRPSISFVSNNYTIKLDCYTYKTFPLYPQIVDEDSFNSEFFDKMNCLCKIMVYESIENEIIRKYIIDNILKNIDITKKHETQLICDTLSSLHALSRKRLFYHIYKKDVPLKEQYNILSKCFSADKYVCNGFKAEELLEDKETRDILEECYMNTSSYYYKSLYIAENYKRLSKKYNINVYELLKNNVPYTKIKGLKLNITNPVFFYVIEKCVNINRSNYIDHLDFLFYSIDKAKKKDLNKAMLTLISRIVIDSISNYSSYHIVNKVCMTNEANMQLVAETIVEEINKTKKNRSTFIKKVRMINHKNEKSLISKLILNNIYVSNDIKIKKH